MSVIEQHYRILGLNSRQCDLNDVKKAFKSKALQLHPDRNPNKSDDAFKRVHAAYEAILAYHHRNQRHPKQSNVGKSPYNATSNMSNYYSHSNSNSTSNNNTKQSSIFSNYYPKPSEHTPQSSTPLFTEEELFGSHTIPGGWVFRDGATRKPRFTNSSNTTNSSDHAATRQEATNTTTNSNTPNLPELSSSQSSMKTAYEAAEQHWRQAHGPRVPVSGYKSPFHIPFDFTEATRNNNNKSSSNNNDNDSRNNTHKDVEDVKAKYKQYREEQQQNLHILAQQHAQLHNGKKTAFEFSKYSTAEEKKAALHERWNSLEKNISNKISVAGDLVGAINHDHNKSTTNINNNNNVNVTKHYSCTISPDEAALLMAEVAAMSERKNKKKTNHNRTDEKEEINYEEKEWEDLQNEESCREECKSHEQTEDQEEWIHCNIYNSNFLDKNSKKNEKEISNLDDNKCDDKREKNRTEGQCHETSPHTTSTSSTEEQVKEENNYVLEEEETEKSEQKKISEAHRDELSHERRELMYQLFYEQYAPDPALVSQMSDAELYTLLQLFHDVSNKLEKVLNVRLTSSHCSRCGKYGTIDRSTTEANDQNVYTTMMDKEEVTFDQENIGENIHCKEKNKENDNVNELDEKATSIKAKVNVFQCAHVCVCRECAKWATECPLCGASIKDNIERDVQTITP